MYHAQYINIDIITWTTPRMSTATLERGWKGAKHLCQMMHSNLWTRWNVHELVGMFMNSLECSWTRWNVQDLNGFGFGEFLECVCVYLILLWRHPLIARLVQIKHVHGIIGHVCGNGIVPTVQYYNSST